MDTDIDQITEESGFGYGEDYDAGSSDGSYGQWLDHDGAGADGAGYWGDGGGTAVQYDAMPMDGFVAGQVSAAPGARGSAELVLEQVYVLPEGARDIDSLSLGAQVRNDGGTESGPFIVRFWLDGVVINNLTWESVPPGQRKWQEFDHPAIAAGAHHLAAMADIDNHIHETNKDDNLATLDFQIHQMSVVIEDGDPDLTWVIEIGAGRTGTQEIDDFVGKLANGITEVWTRYSDGLQIFSQTIENASASEAEFNMDTVVKVAAKKMFDQAISAVADAVDVPGLKQGVDLIKTTVEAYFAEKDRSNKAWSEHEIKEYINDVRRQIQGPRTSTREAVEALKQPLADAFADASKNDPQHGKATEKGVIEGEGAKFLLNLRETLSSFESHMPRAEDFEREIAAAFAHVASRGGEVQGRLIYYIDLYRIPAGWAPSRANGWDLDTSAPGEHARLAEALKESLNGKKPWQVDLPKVVVLALSSDQGDDPFGKAEIHFTDDPGSYELTAIEAKDVEHATKELRGAWDQNWIKALALDDDRIEAQ